MEQCRLCGRLKDFLIDLFLNENSVHEVSLISKINSFLPFNIEQQNELPTTICGECVDRSLDAYDFIQVVIQAQNIFTGEEMKPTVPANSIKYGTTTISSAGSQINVNPPRIPKKTKKMNVSEALKKLKNVGSHITISKKIVSAEEARDESSDDDNLDNNYGPAMGGTSDSDDSNNANGRNIRKTVKDKSSIKMKKKKPNRRTIKRPNKTKYSVKTEGPPVFLCMKCNIKFQSFVELKKHLAEINDCNMSEYVCSICQRLCETKKVLTQHVLECHKSTREQFCCHTCGKMFRNPYVLENHSLIQHGESSEEFSGTYKCRRCNQKFSSRSDLYVHTRHHDTITDPLCRLDLFCCEKCGKMFKNMHNLNNHIRLHGLQPFPCEFADICKKTFRTRLLLRQHLHVHTGIKAFKCPEDGCTKEFAKSESLRAHRKKHVENKKPEPEPEPEPSNSSANDDIGQFNQQPNPTPDWNQTEPFAPYV